MKPDYTAVTVYRLMSSLFHSLLSSPFNYVMTKISHCCHLAAGPVTLIFMWECLPTIASYLDEPTHDSG